ncbi:hypothetical protein [Janibacter melonis]|uniref:hypothetical protein n=1 Tax=Janibacter melonis TaxID=262209 RepID=UPI0012EECE2D|nr:hypothetical protein [Janibacter melonis]
MSEAAVLRRSGWWERAVDHTIRASLHERKTGLPTDRLVEEVARDLSFQDTTFIKGRLLFLVSHGEAVEETSRVYLSEGAREEVRIARERNIKVNRLVEQRYESIRGSIDGGSGCPDWPDFENRILTPLISELGAHTIELLNGTPGSPARTVMQRFLDGGGVDGPALRDIGSKFFDPDDVHVRKYVFRELQAYYLTSVRALDKSTLGLLTKNNRPVFDLLLDTNAVFSMLNLHHNPANEAAKYLLALKEQVADFATVRFHVLETTLDEARAALESARFGWAQAVRTSEQAVALGNDLHANGLIDRYKEVARNSPITAETYFVEQARYLDVSCSSIGVEILGGEGIDEDARFRSRVNVWLDWQEGRRRPRPRGAVKHDIMCMTYVEKMRKVKARVVADAGWWLLTVDQRLRNFEKSNIAGNKTLPLSIAPDELTQVLQFWAPLPEDLDKAMVVGMRLPFSFYDYDNEAQRTSLEILSTLNDFEGADSLSAEATRRILVDKTVRELFARPHASEDQRRVEIESAAFRELNRAVRENAELSDALKKLPRSDSSTTVGDARRDAVEAGKDRAKKVLLGKVEAAKREADKAEKALRREKVQHAAERAEWERRVSDLEEEAKSRDARTRKRRDLIGLTAASATAALIPVALVIGYYFFYWDDRGRLWRLGAILILGTAASAATLPILARKMKVIGDWRIKVFCETHRKAIWAMLAAALVGTIIQLAIAPPAGT